MSTPQATPPATSRATPQAKQRRGIGFPFPSTRVTLPILVLLGYAALVMTGYQLFGLDSQNILQPLPLYVYLCILLLALQADISVNKSTSRVIYLFLTSGFAVVYAGSAVFATAGDFTRSPYTYIILTALLVCVFIYDAIDRRREHSLGLESNVPARRRERVSDVSYQSFGSDFAALAVLFYVAWILQDTLGPQAILKFLHLDLGIRPRAIVDLNATLGLHLDPSISRLEALDLVIALFATAIALLLLGIVGVLSIASPQPAATTAPAPDGARRAPSIGDFGRNLRTIVLSAVDQVALSLRLVLGPLVWLIPAFSIAAFSQQVTQYLNQSWASVVSGNTTDILSLFFPLSRTAVEGIPTGILDVFLGALAVSAVVVAVTVVEHNWAVIADTWRVLRLAGRTLALTLAFFIYSLAALNAVLIIAPPHYNRAPFQVGAAGLGALLLAVVFVVIGVIEAQIKSRAKPPVPVAAAR